VPALIKKTSQRNVSSDLVFSKKILKIMQSIRKEKEEMRNTRKDKNQISEIESQIQEN
jgi:hypothetical protein